ncbi:MAG: M20/M25/M40 family metallo-hydrolase [Planctomycetota bacterium]
MIQITQKMLAAIQKKAQSAELRKHAENLLVKLVGVDTTPRSDPRVTAGNEARVFNMIREEIKTILGEKADMQFLPIDPKITRSPHYTPPHYTKTPERPDGLTVEETYRNRGNLLVAIPGRGGDGLKLAMNSHVDTVAPHFPPRVEGDLVYGRGTADAKGQVVAMLMQMKILKEVMEEFGISLNKDIYYQIVIEEEPGGNGSLSLAVQDPFPFDVLLVFEITEMKVHPGNRGALWYMVTMNPAKGINPVEMAASVVLAMEEEGRRIKAESDHPLFPTRPVQTCQGILGPFGRHPSAVNDHIVLHIETDTSEGDLKVIIDRAIGSYCKDYDDKTKVVDPRTKQVLVERHYDLEGGDFQLTIHGKAGHMGAILECDDAITKMAYIVRDLIAYRKSAGRSLGISLDGHAGRELILEGGQGFVPTHEISEVMDRMRSAVERGARAYCERIGAEFKPGYVKTTYDKLHNAAFARQVDTPAMQTAVDACKKVGLWKDEPIIGWNVSCDARIFAATFPDREVLTFGVGSLSEAHAANEFVSLGEIMKAAEMATVYALELCGWKRNG